MVAESVEWRIAAACTVLLTGLLGVGLPSLIRHYIHKRERRLHATKDADSDDDEDASSDSVDAAGVLPYSLQCAVRILLAMGGGVILTTGTIHILPEARAMLDEARQLNAAAAATPVPTAIPGVTSTPAPTTSNDDRYPIPELIASAVIVFFYIVENELTIFLLRSKEKEASAAADSTTAKEHAVDAHHAAPRGRGDAAGPADLQQQSSSHGPGPSSAVATGGGGRDSQGPESPLVPATRAMTDSEKAANDDALDAKRRLVKASVTTHVLEIGVAVHSLVVGFSLGMQTELGELRTLVIAICFHQFCEGIAIGASIVASRLPKCHSLGLMALFGFTAPGGIALGLVVSVVEGHHVADSAKSKTVQGVLAAVAAGILLYMALVDIFGHLFEPLVRPLPKSTQHHADVGSAVLGGMGVTPVQSSGPSGVRSPSVRGGVVVDYGATGDTPSRTPSEVLPPQLSDVGRQYSDKAVLAAAQVLRGSMAGASSAHRLGSFSGVHHLGGGGDGAASERACGVSEAVALPPWLRGSIYIGIVAGAAAMAVIGLWM